MTDYDALMTDAKVTNEIARKTVKAIMLTEGVSDIDGLKKALLDYGYGKGLHELSIAKYEFDSSDIRFASSKGLPWFTNSVSFRIKPMYVDALKQICLMQTVALEQTNKNEFRIVSKTKNALENLMTGLKSTITHIKGERIAPPTKKSKRNKSTEERLEQIGKKVALEKEAAEQNAALEKT